MEINCIAMGLKQEYCDHKFRFSHLDQYIGWYDHASTKFYQAKIFHCEKCLLEKKIEKKYLLSSYNDNPPEWVQTMKNSKK